LQRIIFGWHRNAIMIYRHCISYVIVIHFDSTSYYTYSYSVREQSFYEWCYRVESHCSCFFCKHIFYCPIVLFHRKTHLHVATPICRRTFNNNNSYHLRSVRTPSLCVMSIVRMVCNIQTRTRNGGELRWVACLEYHSYGQVVFYILDYSCNVTNSTGKKNCTIRGGLKSQKHPLARYTPVYNYGR
jgi:hypothetical protein